MKNVLIVVKKKKVTLQKGKSKKIPIRVTPVDSFHALTFRSKNKKIATINKNGKIKAKKKGTTRIIVNIPNGTKISIKVIVKKTKKKSQNAVGTSSTPTAFLTLNYIYYSVNPCIVCYPLPALTLYQ